MAVYSCKVVVEYYFDIDGQDYGITSQNEAEDYAWLHYDEFPFSADVYSIDVEETESDDDEEEDSE